MSGCECSVVESYFNYFEECMNEAEPSNIPYVFLPLGCSKTVSFATDVHDDDDGGDVVKLMT